MKEFIVNLDHTTRQQITVLADTEEDAAMLVHGMYCTTNALTHLPITSTTGRVICGDVKMVIPTVNYFTRIISDHEDDFPGDEEGEEIDCEHDFSDAADEVEAALEHLEYALSKLYGENE